MSRSGSLPDQCRPPVRVEVEAYPDQTYPGTITRVSPTVEVESRSFQVEASVPNPKGLLKPGFFAKASILVGAERNVPFVPEEAVVSFAGIVKVYAIVEGKAEERRVKTGVRRDGRVEILDGVKVGETIATSSLGQLATGTAVTVQAGPRNGGAADHRRKRPAGGIAQEHPEVILGTISPAAHATVTPRVFHPTHLVLDASHFMLDSGSRPFWIECSCGFCPSGKPRALGDRTSA